MLGWPLFRLPGFNKMSSALEVLCCVLELFLFRCIKNTDAAKKNREVLFTLKITRLYYT